MNASVGPYKNKALNKGHVNSVEHRPTLVSISKY